MRVACALWLCVCASAAGPGTPGLRVEPMNPDLVRRIVVVPSRHADRGGTVYVVFRPVEALSAFWDRGVQFPPMAVCGGQALAGRITPDAAQTCEFYALSLRAVDSALACLWNTAELPPDPWSRQEAMVSAVGLSALRSDLQRVAESYRRASVPAAFEETRTALADSLAEAADGWPDVAGLLEATRGTYADELDHALSRFADRLHGLSKPAEATRRTLLDARSRLEAEGQASGMSVSPPMCEC